MLFPFFDSVYSTIIRALPGYPSSEVLNRTELCSGETETQSCGFRLLDCHSSWSSIEMDRAVSGATANVAAGAPAKKATPALASTTTLTPQRRKSKWGRAIASVKIANTFNRSARVRAESAGIRRQRSWRKRDVAREEIAAVPASDALDQAKIARKSVLLDFDVASLGSGTDPGGDSNLASESHGRSENAAGDVDLTEIGVQVLLEALGQMPNNAERRTKIDLSDPQLALTSRAFEEIGYISGERVTKWDSRRQELQDKGDKRSAARRAVTRASLDTVSDMILSFNQLDSLLPIALRADGSRAFQNLEVLLVDHNSLACICPGFRSQLNYNAWPYEMRSLLHLDLSYNRMADVPDLMLMPNLQILNLKHNHVTLFSFPNVAQGHNLQVLDLSENRLSWSPREFVQDLVHLHLCRDMRRVCFASNPFLSQLENYFMFVVQSMFDKDLVAHQGLKPSALTFVDDVQIHQDMALDAVGLTLSDDQFSAGRSPPLLGADLGDSDNGVTKADAKKGGNILSDPSSRPASREEAGITVLTNKDKIWHIRVENEPSGQAMLDGKLPSPTFGQILHSMQRALKRPRDAHKEVRRALMLCSVIASLPEEHIYTVRELVDDKSSASEDVHIRFQHVLEVSRGFDILQIV